MNARLTHVQALIATEPSTPQDADGMVGGLRRLCRALVRVLPAAGAGLSVMTEGGVRGVAAASNEASERIDELQFELGEGPCMDAFMSRRPVLEADLAVGGMTRWPLYAAAANSQGVGAAFAFPLQIGAARLGVLDMYRQLPGSLSAEELAQALTFADLATTMLLDAQADAPLGDAADGLGEALEYRFELHQAQGMVMVQLGVGLATALALLRAYAYANDRHLDQVARDVVTRRVRLDQDRDDDA